MNNIKNKIIFLIDVTSAYLSWTSIRMLQLGITTEDYREVPSIVGGSTDQSHGIVLAKSLPAKKFNILTGEPIIDALKKCPNLKILKPDYSLYIKCSNAMYELVQEYSPSIERYSIDEVFIDVSHYKNNYMSIANEIKNRIKEELGFDVKIGISSNKLLAKMASKLPPTNSIHTIFPEEVENKLWPLPVGDLFMVGKATKSKLDFLNIETIGDLATYDLNLLTRTFKSHGKLIKDYANGIDTSSIKEGKSIRAKGIGSSTTLSWNVINKSEAFNIILSLTESVANRLRETNSVCKVVSISIKGTNLVRYSHQLTLDNFTDSTEEIYSNLKKAFISSWKGEPIRQLGIRLSCLTSNEFYQSSLFDNDKHEKQRTLDKTIDYLRLKYGDNKIIRSSLINSGINPITGGVGEKDYIYMSSKL